jgi:hypothetical protein
MPLHYRCFESTLLPDEVSVRVPGVCVCARERVPKVVIEQKWLR